MQSGVSSCYGVNNFIVTGGVARAPRVVPYIYLKCILLNEISVEKKKDFF